MKNSSFIILSLIPLISFTQGFSNNFNLGVAIPFISKEENFLLYDGNSTSKIIDARFTTQKTWGIESSFQNVLSKKHDISIKTGYQWRLQKSKFSFNDDSYFELPITANYNILSVGLNKRIQLFDSVLSISVGSNLQFRTYHSNSYNELPEYQDYKNDTTIYLLKTFPSSSRPNLALDFEISAALKISKRFHAYTNLQLSPRYSIGYSFNRIRYDVTQNGNTTEVVISSLFYLNNNRYSYSLVNLSFGLIYDF